jgi:hypothetical protein
MKQYKSLYATTAVSGDDYDDDDDDKSTITSDSENVIDYQQLIFKKEGTDFP